MRGSYFPSSPLDRSGAPPVPFPGRPVGIIVRDAKPSRISDGKLLAPGAAAGPTRPAVSTRYRVKGCSGSAESSARFCGSVQPDWSGPFGMIGSEPSGATTPSPP